MKKVFENWYKVAALLCLAFVALTFSPSPAHAAVNNTQPVYYLQHKATGENLYTTDTNEVKVLSKGNWKNLGIAWYAPKSGKPVYRMNYRNGVDHHYVTEQSEVKALLARGTWTLDRGKVMWYSGGTTRTYRLYSPGRATAFQKGQRISGFHKFATSEAQIAEFRRSDVWSIDGVKLYADHVHEESCSICGGTGTISKQVQIEGQYITQAVGTGKKLTGLAFASADVAEEWSREVASIIFNNGLNDGVVTHAQMQTLIDRYAMNSSAFVLPSNFVFTDTDNLTQGWTRYPAYETVTDTCGTCGGRGIVVW